jgi:hypothetical protein
MNREDIIRMAREAGWNIVGDLYGEDRLIADIEYFASLVAAAEREACAKVCEELVPGSGRTSQSASAWDCATFDCAAAIRARGQA